MAENPNNQIWHKTEQINSELFGISKNLILEFFEIYDIAGTDEVIRFHGGKNQMSNSLKFDGKEYFYIPYEGSDFSVVGDGGISRPLIKIINFSGFLSRYIIDKDNFIGAKIKRIRTYLRFLDAENFANYESNLAHWKKMGVRPDPNSKFRDDIWMINRKVEENKFYIEFELSNAFDLENVTIPKRKVINNFCSWKYRGEGCKYEGDPVADSNNVKFKDTINFRGVWKSGDQYITNDSVYLNVKEGSLTRRVFYVCAANHTGSGSKKPSVNSDFWVQDACSKTLRGCSLRFGKSNMPFGGFPSSRLY